MAAEEGTREGMSFGGLFDGGGAATAGVQYTYAAGAGSGVFASSPALSLAMVRAAPFAYRVIGVGFPGAVV